MQQPLTRDQIDNIMQDVSNPDGLLATYRELANKLYAPLIEAMTSRSKEKWRATQERAPELSQGTFDYDMARIAHITDLVNASFICGLLLGGSNLSQLLVERLAAKNTQTGSQAVTSETQVAKSGDGLVGRDEKAKTP